MSEPARIALRLFGFLLLLVGLAGIVLLFVPGPRDIADWMGKSCAHTTNGASEQCTIFDVLEMLAMAPILVLVGGILALALRRSGREAPATIDLTRRQLP